MNIERAIGIVRDSSNTDPYTLRVAGSWLALKVVEHEAAGSQLAATLVEHEKLLRKIQGDLLNAEAALTDLMCLIYPQHKEEDK